MANLKEIRIRLNSVKSTRQITSAMKMVSAAKLRKAQDAIVQMRPFANKLQEIQRTASTALNNESTENVFLQPGASDRVLLVVISSNRGLCGAFNSNVIKKALYRISEKYHAAFQGNKLDVMCIGKKGYDSLKSRGLSIIDSRHSILEKLTFADSRTIADKLIGEFMVKKYGSIELIYNQFRNAAIQDVVAESFLPLTHTVSTDEILTLPLNYIYEPTAELLLERLIPMALRIQFHKALLDSLASDHGARMTAMHKATDNATDLIRELELTYNKARQASITNELLEIVSGANALRG
ncbi:MAG: ATP synthase F1 subunit gamma [Bacteroidetes bacterium RBG_13_42_15]|nr:MAG: ATP synthase F1 subunit gamma [Bacteroidetes bacterium RBG_13_42_15]